jgi:hypothetical protein
MPRFEGWAFLCLIGCLLGIGLSLTLLSGLWQAAGCALAAGLGILSGGLYGRSVEPTAAARLFAQADRPNETP